MNKTESMKAYWKNIKLIAENDEVHVQAARKFYKHIHRAFIECQHAESDEEHLSAGKCLVALRRAMKRYDETLGSEYQRTDRR